MDWTIDDSKVVVLDRSDPRLLAFNDLLLRLAEPLGSPLSLSKASSSSKDRFSISGTAAIWGSPQTEVKFSWTPGTGVVNGIALSKPVEGISVVSLPGLTFSKLRQHAVAEVLDSRGVPVHSGFFSGAVTCGERVFSIKLFGHGSPGFELSIDFDPAAQEEIPDYNAPGLRDLAALLGLMDDPHADLQWLPKELQSADLISLTQLSARFEPNDPRKLTYVEVALTLLSGRTWPMIPGCPWLEVGGLTAVLEVEHPLESDYRFPRLTLKGAVVLESVSANGSAAHLDLEVRWPDLAVRGELKEDHPVVLRQLLEHLRIPSGGLPEGMEITQLGFLAETDLAKKRFSFHATVEKPWALELPGQKRLAIENLAFTLPYQEGEAPTMMPSFSGVIAIGGLEITLSGEREADGWRFAGGTGPDQPIKVGEWIEKLVEHFGAVSVPGPVAGAVLQNVEVSFHTATKDFHFSIEAKLPLTELAVANPGAGTDLDIILTLDIVHQGGTSEKKFAGHIVLGDREFDLNFAKSAGPAEGDAATGGTTLVAAYQNTEGDQITLRDLLADIGVKGAEAPDLSITLKSALFAMVKPEKGDSAKFFGINVDGGLNLSNLPLLGKVLPPNETLSLEFQALYSSQKIGKDNVEKWVAPVNALLPPGATPLPTAGKRDGDPVIARGIGLATTLHLGTEVIHLDLRVGFSGTPEKPGQIAEDKPEPVPGGSAGSQSVSAGDTPVPTALPPDDLKWFPIHKSFGPAHFERIGAGLKDGLKDGVKRKEVTFALDASLNIGGLTLSLDGLGVSSPLTKFDPTFQLRGIGIDYASGPVEIGGSFLRLGEDNFAGTALIRTEALTLAAIGAYAKIKDPAGDHTSLFIYAVLDYPLGGPSFFFVTGLAAGFGYNRSLLMPAIDDLPTFPLVAEATAGAGLPKDVMAELKNLGRYVPPDAGQCFLAVGVKFTSFKQINSFALLAVNFGKRFEIDVLGQSTVVVPAPTPGSAKVDPVARVNIALLARFIPDEGLLAIDARVTPGSFILSEKCYLTGGFAFYSWFKGEHSGDFVVSLGGYHPAFNVPAHYPQVPRLAFTWQVAPELVVKGDAYFALTSHALMAGGHLEASYQSGPLRAHFNVGADFLISWQPYHYDARAYINVGGSYDTALGTISIDLGAQLHLWGPEFAGTAELDLYVATVHVTFGDQNQQTKSYIEWSEFKTAFLPEEKDAVSLALEGGLVAAGDPKKSHLGTINPKELRVVTNSVIPSRSLKLGAAPETIPGEKVNVAPVGAADCTSTHTVTISRFTKDSKFTDVTKEFHVERVIKRLPAALWGTPGSGKPEVNAEEKFVDGVTGVRLTPKAPPTAHATKTVKTDDLEWDELKPPTLPAETVSQFWIDPSLPQDTTSRQNIGRTITMPGVVVARNRYLESLKLDPANVRVGGLAGTMFSQEPRMGSFVGPSA